MLDKDSHGKSNVNMPSSLQVGRLVGLPASDLVATTTLENFTLSSTACSIFYRLALEHVTHRLCKVQT